MAERRMFAKTIVTSDAFLDMPATARCLYFLLAMMADDDGFVNAPRSIMRQAGATTDDLNILIAKRFVLTFESGVVVIKHWKIHNLIKNDRYKETKYLEEKSMLTLDDKNAYTEVDSILEPEWNQSGTKVEPQVSKGKVRGRLVEDNKDIEAPDAAPPKPKRHKYGFYQNVLLTDAEYEKLQAEFPHDYSERIERLSEYIASTGKSYKNHLATIRSWARKDADKRKTENGKSGNVFLEMLQERN